MGHHGRRRGQRHGVVVVVIVVNRRRWGWLHRVIFGRFGRAPHHQGSRGLGSGGKHPRTRGNTVIVIVIVLLI